MNTILTECAENNSERITKKTTINVYYCLKKANSIKKWSDTYPTFFYRSLVLFSQTTP